MSEWNCNFKSKNMGYCMLKRKIALNSSKCDEDKCIFYHMHEENKELKELKVWATKVSKQAKKWF